MGAIENRLRKENKSLKTKLDELRNGVNAQYEAKIRALQEEHAAHITKIQAQDAAELQTLADQINHLVKEGEAALKQGETKMNALREKIEGQQITIKSQDEVLINLQGKLDTALATPKKLRDRLQRLRTEKDKTIKDLRTDLAAEREKNWNTFSPKEERRKAALKELRKVAFQVVNSMVERGNSTYADPNDLARIPELLDSLE